MERSEQIGELVSALAKAQAEFSPALKDSSNPAYNSKYADLSTVIGAVRPALAKHGIALIQSNASDVDRQVAIVTTTVYCGEQFLGTTAEAPALGRGRDGAVRFDAQTLGAAWTYLRRYTLQGLLGIASEDDDGNSLVTEQAPPPPARRPAPIAHKGPSVTDLKQWEAEFENAFDLQKFNADILPKFKERSNDYIKLAAAEAKRRGYVPNRATGLYELPERKTA